VDGVTTAASGADFLTAFLPCAQRVARLGLVNSLSQLVLKCTVPGIPDFYQGSESWDFSLVDPDNRREVDYDRRRQLLDAVASAPAAGLLEHWRDGGIKLWVMQKLLQARARDPGLFLRGDYRPIAGEGGFADHLIAFTRGGAGGSLLVVVPRLTARLGSPPLGLTWDDTRLPPVGGVGAWRDLFTGKTFPGGEPWFLRALFAELPFAVLQWGPGSPPAFPL